MGRRVPDRATGTAGWAWPRRLARATGDTMYGRVLAPSDCGRCAPYTSSSPAVPELQRVRSSIGLMLVGVRSA